MGQIVKRKKGRPPKSDLAARERSQPESDLRRSLRRRNVKYVFDLDDYFDEDEVFADDEDRRRREKKLKHLLSAAAGETESTAPRKPGRPPRRVEHAPATSESSSDGEKPSKKRKIDEYVYEDVDGENDETNGGGDKNYGDEDDEEVRERKPEHKAEDSSPGTPEEGSAMSGLPLPDKKSLELILDKLQKKDIYGVYAEPVDPEELPDYHDVIEHPMDFATVRNKLRNGSYATFEQFEVIILRYHFILFLQFLQLDGIVFLHLSVIQNDIFLICSNAMQYNSPDTVYFKQARTIQELAKRKFEKIRLNTECMEREMKPQLRIRSGSNLKKQIKRSVSWTLQEPVGSDFSSGATLTTADFQNVTNALQAVGFEKPSIIDGLVEGNSCLNDNNASDKVEEPVPGKALLSRFCRKSYVPDENRRVTYSIPVARPVASRESIFSTFEGEAKQLVPVGLYSDHSYARSLARFSAALGPFAWKVASKRIEQALPLGYKFGRGWVGEYEPLPTPVVVLGNCTVKEPPFLAKVQPAGAPGKCGKISTISKFSKESAGNIPFREQNLPFLGPTGVRPPSASFISAQLIRGHATEMKPFFLTPVSKPDASPNHSRQHQNIPATESVASERKALKQVELNGPPLNMNPAKCVRNKQDSRRSEMDSSRPAEFSLKNNKFFVSGSFKQPNDNGITFEVHDGKVVDNRVGDVQNCSNPVQSMQMSAESARNQQNPSSMSLVMPSASSPNSNNSNNASVAAARAWMSVGAGGMRPNAESANMNKNQVFADSRDMPAQVFQFRGEFPPGMSVQMDKNNSQARAFGPQGPIPMMVSNQMVFQNPRMVYPQLATANLSRFQLQSNWQNVSPQMLSRPKQESLPPDLNIGFQSSGSPGKPSSGVLVDSQQPDLALQL